MRNDTAAYTNLTRLRVRIMQMIVDGRFRSQPFQ